MAKAKISHIISDSNIGGAGVLLASLTAELKDFFDITVFIPKGARLTPLLDEARATVYQVPMAKDRSFRAGDVQGFFSVFKELKTDIAHTHGTLSARLGALLNTLPLGTQKKPHAKRYVQFLHGPDSIHRRLCH